MKVLKILFYWDVTPGHIENRYHIWYFWAPLEEPSGIFWGRHIWCRIFRRIFWYHSLVPQKKFFRSYSGFRPFFGIPFLAHNSKTAHYWDMVPILSSHFFQFPIRWPIHFPGVEVFWKLSLLFQFSHPILLDLTRSEKYICFGKNGWWCQFPFSRHW